MSQNDSSNSQDSLINADRSVNEFSGVRGALGQAGVRDTASPRPLSDNPVLASPGDQTVISCPDTGFPEIYAGCGWNIQETKRRGLAGLLGMKQTRKVDLDLGCLFQFNDGVSGGLQALGAENGSLNTRPYVWLSHDERTGKQPGDDEFIRVNGMYWNDFQRVLIYAYIYDGAADWSDIRPDLTLKIPGQPMVHIQPTLKRPNLSVCAIAMIDQIRGGMKITNLTEYFPGQAEMDRAYGFGLQWADGVK